MGECFPSTPWQPPPNLIDMAQTSIHFQPVKGGSEEHNQRTKKLDYVHHELSSHNDYWQSCSQESRLAFVADNAKAKTGRKMQAKATPIREAVVVIKDTTTMDDLKDLSKRLHDRFGIEVFQIAIHKDEGYMKSKDGIKLNLHAHLVADWTDHETGKSLKLNRNDMSEMQTLVAECLKMERGKSSEKQHLSAIQFKIKAEEERAAAQQNLTWEVMERKQKIAKEVDKLRSEAIEIKSSNDSLLTTQKALKSEILGLTGKKNSLKADIDEQITEWNERKSEAESLASVVQSARSDLHGLEARRNALDAEILMKSQVKEQAEREAEEAKAKAKQAEAAALSGLVVGGTKKIGNLLGLGKEAKLLKELPQQLAAAKEEGRVEAISEVLKGAGMKYNDMSKVTPEKVGRDLMAIVHKESEAAKEDTKKLKIIQNMTEGNYTYDAAAKLIKEKYADMSFYFADEFRNFAGDHKAFTFKDEVFDPLCERQGAHNVSTTDNAIGRREICAQGIVCACIRFFDSMKLDRLASTLKAMAQNFNLGEWRKMQEPTQSRSQERNQNQERSRGWHL